ncbi:transcription termination factor, mitochondrial-like isoform X2 [Panulirus ornatus]
MVLSTKARLPHKSKAADILGEECSPEGEFNWQDRKSIEVKGSRKEIYVGETVLQGINSLFDINREEAVTMFCSRRFLQISDKAVLKTLDFLKEHNITSHQIKRIPWILLHSEGSLQEKFAKLTEPYLFQNCSDGLGFCHFPLEQISIYQKSFMSEAAKFPYHNNRLYYLAEKLKVPVECLTEKIVKPHRILFMEMKRLEDMIDIFQRYGMHSEDILADMWVFAYCPKKAEERLQHAVDLGCQALKPWMCRCSSHIFNRYCERYHTGKLLFNKHKDITGYLSEKLQCEPQMVERLFQSNSLLKKIHITKFERVFNLLFSEGLTPEEIRSCMRVFQYSDTRTAERIQELKKIGYFPFPLIILCKTPNQFKNVITQYKNQHNIQYHKQVKL